MMQISVDTGGTFTDVMLEHEGQWVTFKTASTPEDPGRAVVVGIRGAMERAGLTSTRPVHVLHGTTVGTNALLEHRGARVLLVTTAGFEDLLRLGRQARPGLYALLPTSAGRDTAFVLGVDERLSPDGGVERPLTQATQETLLEAIGELCRNPQSAPEAVAICLLHAYANPEPERALLDAIRDRFPHLVVCRSSEILPELREFERCSTTVANASIAPVMSRYLDRLSREPSIDVLRVMQSNGGLMSASEAARFPIHTALSGPAGGVVGGWRAGREAGFARVVTLDMGGTSTDVALCAGALHWTTRSDLGGAPICVPMLDIHTVGAGGGSLARIDAGGALKVGPESAGADPGPACYGRGTLPTVSDANLVLGRLLPEHFLGGAMTLHPERAKSAIEPLAQALNASLEDTAMGILDVAIAAMARALKVISVERGHDPRALALVAFGGAGALHACALANELGMPAVVIPPAPGLLSAMGMLHAKVLRHASRSLMLRIEAQAPHAAEAPTREALSQLQQTAAAHLTHDQVAPESQRFEAEVDMRYLGQSFELRVPYTAERGVAEAIKAFEQAHEDRYGYRMNRPLELVTLRVRGMGASPSPPRQHVPAYESPMLERALLGREPAFFDGLWSETLHLERAALGAGDRLQGPCIIAEYSATTVVPPGWSGTVVESGAMVLERDATTSPRG